MATAPAPGSERRGRKTPEPSHRPQPRLQNPGHAAAHPAPSGPAGPPGTRPLPAAHPPWLGPAPRARPVPGPAPPQPWRTAMTRRMSVTHTATAGTALLSRGSSLRRARMERPQRRCRGNQLRPLGAQSGPACGTGPGPGRTARVTWRQRRAAFVRPAPQTDSLSGWPAMRAPYHRDPAPLREPSV